MVYRAELLPAMPTGRQAAGRLSAWRFYFIYEPLEIFNLKKADIESPLLPEFCISF
jgi:hypothetical protein